MELSTLKEHIEYQKAYNSWCKRLFTMHPADLDKTAKSVSRFSALKYRLFGASDHKETNRLAKRDAAIAILDTRKKDASKGTGSLDSILVKVEKINSRLPLFPYAAPMSTSKYVDADAEEELYS